ncbi:MAG: helix-turn-helix domain-containing protein [Clostridia bacterium]|nr:helix-turn-helix domain-containing protein [Clostridia bacterium]
MENADITAALEEIISKDPLLSKAVTFSNGINVYALLHGSYVEIYATLRKVLRRLLAQNKKCIVLFSGKISSFHNACVTLAGLDWQATQLRISDANVDIVYYDNSLYLFNMYDEFINVSKSIGQQIRNNSGTNVEPLVDSFFEKMQQGSLLRSHIHFFVMQMLISAVGEDVLNENMSLILECNNRLQLKNLVIDICLAHNDYRAKISNKEEIVERICAIIGNEYQTPLSLEVVAKKVYLSPTYVSRIFKEYTGVNFSRYIKDFRLNKSKELLENEAFRVNNINEIAEAVGFLNVAFFCASFKEKFGVSPTKYRRNLTE